MSLIQTTRNNLLDMVSTDFTLSVSKETLLIVYWEYIYKKLDTKSTTNLKQLAYTSKLLNQLHCGIKEHITDCRCTTRFDSTLNECPLIDDIVH